MAEEKSSLIELPFHKIILFPDKDKGILVTHLLKSKNKTFDCYLETLFNNCHFCYYSLYLSICSAIIRI